MTGTPSDELSTTEPWAILPYPEQSLTARIDGGPINPSHDVPGPIYPGFKLLILVLLFCQVCACIVGSKPSLKGNIDLRPFYAAGSILHSGHAAQLYNYSLQQDVQNALVGPRDAALPFLYPPFAAWLFVPLSFVKYRAAFFVVLFVNLLLLLAAASLIAPTLSALRKQDISWLVAFYACSFAVSIACMQGQISFLLLLLCAAVHRCVTRRKDFTGGLLLSVMLIKFQIALAIFGLFLLWRQWRFAIGFLLGAAAAAIVSWLTVGSRGLGLYCSSISSVVGQEARHAAEAKARFGMFPTDMPNLHGLTFGISHGAPWGGLLNLVLCAAIVLWVSGQRPSMLLAIPAAMLFSYHMQPHDLILLLIPISYLLNDMAITRRQPSPIRTSLLQRQSALYLGLSPLYLPVAPTLMAYGIGYLTSLTVAFVMVRAAARRS